MYIDECAISTWASLCAVRVIVKAVLTSGLLSIVISPSWSLMKTHDLRNTFTSYDTICARSLKAF